MKTIEAKDITESVRRLCMKANYDLPSSVANCLKDYQSAEPWPVAKDVLSSICKNFELAKERRVPICQDTGMACVFLEIGQDVHIDGNLMQAVNEGVRQGYSDGYLRCSVVGDPLHRVNTKDNTPAMLYTELVEGENLTITVAPKGFGSENMSAISMLRPSDGVDGVIDFVLQTVEKAGPNPCPPIVVGVGIGGTFDKAALISKKALLRDIGTKNQNPFYAELEETLLHKINSLGIGPQGFGGATTALSVAIETLPTHIAGLPCAVNINCHVSRHAQEVL